MSAATDALAAARDALEEIALAGMSGTGQESPEGMRDWHARRAWEFIGIAARALGPVRAALATPPASEGEKGLPELPEPAVRGKTFSLDWGNMMTVAHALELMAKAHVGNGHCARPSGHYAWKLARKIRHVLKHGPPPASPALGAAQAVPAGWQPIETAPEGRAVLACNALGFIGRAYREKGRWNHIGRPTHWMAFPPLPPIPHAEGGAL